ncbi:MAG: uracil-DNA glycosylase [Verrucomicrobiales bacterium]|nr:uracil-DNA glycosylase [Verrucomicrobiales bacterium]
MIAVPFDFSFDDWRDHARQLLSRGIAPDEVDWTESRQDRSLFSMEETLPPPAPTPHHNVPASFLTLARHAWAHRDPRRPGVLYRMLWRLTRGGEKHLMSIPTDPDFHTVAGWRKSVARDIHKMHAFVRFRLVGTDDATGREQFVAWFEPSSQCLRLAVPFFVNRFAGMDWSILTPDECAHWDGKNLQFTPGLSKDSVPPEDGLDDLWRTYYRSIFNPARLKVKAMQSEMPVKYWKNLPEAPLIQGLITTSRTRMEIMLETPGRTEKPIPDNSYIQNLHTLSDIDYLDILPPPQALAELPLPELQAAARICRACPLWAKATQTVNGHGPADARIVLVGEQPGDQEDLAGTPFIGPAGKVLRAAMARAGVDEKSVYMTNAVKHFKWTPDGPRRKHVTPGREEVQHCRPWLLAEMARIQPAAVVLLGATAGLSLLNREVRITRERGLIDAPHIASRVVLTYHPSYLLRLRDGTARDRAMAEFEADLAMVAGF